MLRTLRREGLGERTHAPIDRCAVGACSAPRAACGHRTEAAGTEAAGTEAVGPELASTADASLQGRPAQGRFGVSFCRDVGARALAGRPLPGRAGGVLPVRVRDSAG